MAKMNFKDECIASGGVKCPYCGKYNTQEYNFVDSDDEDDVRKFTVECHDCGKEWTTTFRIEDITEVDEED
jgi:transcriptional regulator NrdR family protein